MNRVVVTGCGVVCALGNSFAELSAALRTGRSGVRLISPGGGGRLGVAACPAADERDCELTSTERALFDPVTRYAVRAAREAIAQSGLPDDPELCRTAGTRLARRAR